MELRDYQVRTLEMIKESIRKGNKRVAVYSPTGSGKSICAASIVQSALDKGNRAAFLVNRKKLVHQFANHLYSIGIKPGVAQGENTHNLHRNVLVGTSQTLARRGMGDFDVILVDEAHFVSGSREYRNLIFANKDKLWLFFTATPFAKGMSRRYDEIDGEELMQDLIIPTTISELIEQKYLVDVDIFAPSEPDMEGVRLQKNSFGEYDYSEKETEKRVNKVSLVGDIVKNWKLLANGQQTIAFAHSINHSKHIAESFLSKGVKADHIDSYMDDAERDEVFERFEGGETTVLCNVGILKEGVDIPAAAVMILAKPTKSLTSYIQMVGRVLRPYPGKEKGLVLDHSGSSWQLDYPTQDLPLELDDGEKKDTDSKKREKKTKEEVLCSVCMMVKRSLKCGNCGNEPYIPDGVEYKKGELKKIERKQTKTQKLSQDKEYLYAQLKQVAIDRKWSDGKLSSQFKNITGIWPDVYRHVDPVKPMAETLNMLKYLQIRSAKSRRHHA